MAIKNYGTSLDQFYSNFFCSKVEYATEIIFYNKYGHACMLSRSVLAYFATAVSYASKTTLARSKHIKFKFKLKSLKTFLLFLALDP